jgi:hypothetical protein
MAPIANCGGNHTLKSQGFSPAAAANIVTTTKARHTTSTKNILFQSYQPSPIESHLESLPVQVRNDSAAETSSIQSSASASPKRKRFSICDDTTRAAAKQSLPGERSVVSADDELFNDLTQSGDFIAPSDSGSQNSSVSSASRPNEFTAGAQSVLVTQSFSSSLLLF